MSVISSVKHCHIRCQLYNVGPRFAVIISDISPGASFYYCISLAAKIYVVILPTRGFMYTDYANVYFMGTVVNKTNAPFL